MTDSQTSISNSETPWEDPPNYTSSVEQTAPPYQDQVQVQVQGQDHNRSRQAANQPPPARVITATKNNSNIEAILDKIKWGRFQDHPACFIGIKLQINEPTDRPTLLSSHCSISFPTSAYDAKQQKQSNVHSPAVQILKILPLRRAGPKVTPTQPGYAVSIGSDTPHSALRSAWQLEGKIDIGRHGEKLAAWDVAIDLSTKAPLPKELRLGVIVAYDEAEKRLDLALEVKAQYRSLMSAFKGTKGDSARMMQCLDIRPSGVGLDEMELYSFVTLYNDQVQS